MCVSKVLHKTLMLSISLIFCYSVLSNKTGDTFTTIGLPIFLIYVIVPNSQLFLFYSEQRHITFYGYVTNWNSAGYFDVYYSVRKYRINVLSMSAIIHKDNETFNCQCFFINGGYCAGNETY